VLVCRWPYFGQRDNRRDPFAVRDEGHGNVDASSVPTRSIAAVTPSGEGANSLEQSIAIDDRLYSETAKSLLLVLTRGSDHSGAVGYRELHGHQAHASGRPCTNKVSPALVPDARSAWIAVTPVSINPLASSKDIVEGFGNTLLAAQEDRWRRPGRA